MHSHSKGEFKFFWLVTLLLLVAAMPATPANSSARTSQSQAGSTNRPHRRVPVDIRDREPDSANLPNSAFTLREGQLYIENSPFGYLFGAEQVRREYQWQFLIRYGLTDRVEFRVFSNGLTARGKPDPTTGFSPLAFDVKAHLWDERRRHFIPAVGVEVYIQTDLGSRAFDSGAFPSVNLLFDHTLPGGIAFEYNLGVTREENVSGRSFHVGSFPWSFTRAIVEDFDVFVQGFYGSETLPRIQQVRITSNRPPINAVGAGALWTLNARTAVWGSYTFGTTRHSPDIVILGFAVAF
jgi:hypothetical protein